MPLHRHPLCNAYHPPKLTSGKARLTHLLLPLSPAVCWVDTPIAARCAIVQVDATNALIREVIVIFVLFVCLCMCVVRVCLVCMCCVRMCVMSVSGC